jgi:hypothetical protein
MTYDPGQSLSRSGYDPENADNGDSAAMSTRKRPGSILFDAFGRPGRRGVRMPTVVLGLVLLVIAVSVTIGQLTDIDIDPGAIVIAVMIGAGILLVTGARRRP